MSRPHTNIGQGMSSRMRFASLLSMAAMIGGGMDVGDRSPVNDTPEKPDKAAPEYVKTPEDIERLARAEAKRKRKKGVDKTG